jgi:hypothetical protein
VLPHVTSLVSAPLAPPQQEACTRAAMWPSAHDSSVGFVSPRGGLSCRYVALCPWWLTWLCLPVRRAPMSTHGPTRVAAPLALSLREADSHGVTWPCPHGDSLGSASLRGELPCYHVNPPPPPPGLMTQH